MLLETRKVAGTRAVVTGSSGFIGREVVRLLAYQGAKVLGVDIEDWEHTSSNFEFCQADVVVQDAWSAIVSKAKAFFGGIDTLIHCVGAMNPTDGGLEAVDATAWDQTMAVNAKSAWLAAAAVVPELRASGGGSIVYVGSLVASRGSSIPQLAYTASKGAVSALSRELAVYLVVDNIRVNCVSPGPLEGGICQTRLDGPTQLERRLRHIPAGRLGTAYEVALACVYLASEDASYVTGVDLVVDGGVSASFISRS